MKSIFIKYPVLKLLLIIIPIFTIVRLNKYINEIDKKHLMSYPKTCGFFFKSTSNKAGEMSWFRYKVDDQVYEIRGGRFDSRTFGNFYSIAYDSTDPEDIVVDWSEQWLKQNVNNLTLFVNKVNADTVPNTFGWNKIIYSYILGGDTYEGCRFVKENLFRKVNIDSIKLQCSVNPNYPKNSYLFWPGEQPLVNTE